MEKHAFLDGWLNKLHNFFDDFFNKKKSPVDTEVKIPMYPVASSNLKALGYSPSTNTLEVQFRSGSKYRYSDVSQRDFNRLYNSESKGRHFHRYIRNEKNFMKVAFIKGFLKQARHEFSANKNLQPAPIPKPEQINPPTSLVPRELPEHKHMIPKIHQPVDIPMRKIVAPKLPTFRPLPPMRQIKPPKLPTLKLPTLH